MEDYKYFDELVRKSSVLSNKFKEIEDLIKNKKSFTPRESKNIDEKVLDFLEECANELLKIKDLKLRKNIGWGICLMMYNFYTDETEEDSILSEGVRGVFYTFQKEENPKEILKEIKLARENLSEFYVGF